MVHFEHPKEENPELIPYDAAPELSGNVIMEAPGSITENSAPANPENVIETDTKNSSYASPKLSEVPVAVENKQPPTKPELDPNRPIAGTNEGLPDHVDSKEEIAHIAPLAAIVKERSTLKNGDMAAVMKWNEDKYEFVKLLLEGGIITEEQLKATRMFHVLNGSTPIGGTVEAFDLPGGVLERFIKSRANENPLA